MDYADFGTEQSYVASEFAMPEAAIPVVAAIPLVPGPDCTIVLPAGATLEQMERRGRDLILAADYGQPYVITDGADFLQDMIFVILDRADDEGLAS